MGAGKQMNMARQTMAKQTMAYTVICDARHRRYEYLRTSSRQGRPPSTTATQILGSPLERPVPKRAGHRQHAAHTPGACPHHHAAGALDARALLLHVGLVVHRQRHRCSSRHRGNTE